MREAAARRLEEEFGAPSRDVVKVKAWEVSAIGIVLQVDQPNREDAAYLWLPYPQEGHQIPEIALEYAGESGRHSGTYASSGLHRGEPALKLIIRTERELDSVVKYVRAMTASAPLPPIPADASARPLAVIVDSRDMPPAAPMKPKREAIPRAVQREIWQRDGGRCVECSSRELLCFDHIVPFSRGGSNTMRNIQLLCERCNLSKGNRI
jgi:hypothetical protein